MRNMAKIMYIAFVFLFFYASSADSALQTVNGTIHVRIGTTAACSDAARFIQSQVLQTYELYKEYLEIEFVPWGRTRRDAQGNLNCQFGENDCWANRVQRCVLSLLAGNTDVQVKYMLCEFSPPFPALRQRSLLCAQSVGLSVIEVDYCMTTTGNALEGPAELASTAAVEAIRFIPFIVFNNNINVNQHVQAYRNLRSTICFALADDPTTGITYCKI
ncbi:GILT-like protein F37H8.5 [Vanessa atalanta]|uniref:GILT-like protein F37H8.5 n=1 Tax=Vanessa atalanta TaxID=42275 RepID=UPI001FCD2FFC|nr:GILT-like protein F37H8.5 [Vanessa atalanta]